MIPVNAPYKPSHAVLQSAAWLELKQHLTNRLDDLRKLNDNPEHSVEQTAFIRGQIKETKRLIALGEPDHEVAFGETH